ncbi:MAG: hypothetical protein EA357_03445 [Micavibrio sp.]|nr:MAG: hypothetical protein EA357_03445 [Micavibrio sp.]
MDANLHPVLLFYFSMNETMQSLLLGCLVLAVVLLAALPFAGRVKKLPFMHLALVAGLIAAFLVPQHINRALELRYGDSVVIATAKQQFPLFSKLFEQHPEAERELRSHVKAAIADGIYGAELADLITAKTAEISGRYLQRYLPLAADAAVHENLSYSAETLAQLRENPALCAAYAEGRIGHAETAALQKALGQGAIDKSHHLQFEVIRTALDSPVPPKTPLTAEEIQHILYLAYSRKGLNLNGLAALDTPEDFSEEERCTAHIDFLTVLADMPHDGAAHVFKSLMRLSAP